MRQISTLLSFFLIFSLSQSQADTLVMQETRVDRVWDEYNLSGEGVIIAVLDRGIDYEHIDFRNQDGSTRILYIFDMFDQTGVNAPGNTYGVGTIYDESEINNALTTGVRLNHRDAVGHGTPSAGIAGGNGRASNGIYQGVAPNAQFIIVKMASEGSPAHGNEPAEQAQPLGDIEKALDFVLDKADEAGKPVVLLANFGSIGGPTDGTSDFARAVDARFGPNKAGRVFVNGTGDDGGADNHAAGTITQGQSIDLNISKVNAGFLRFSLWYSDQDRFEVEIIGPNGSLGTYAAPDNVSRDTQTGTNFTYYHNGRELDFFRATSPTREILIDFTGPAADYTIRLTGTTISEGSFNASLNPSNIFGANPNEFTSFVEAGSSIWYGATAQYNIAPNSYVVRQNWTDIDGVSRTFPGNEGGFGSLWTGSSIGPTYDGRLGTTVSVPGNTNIGAYGVRSYFNTLRFNVIQGGNDPYGTLGAVSGAAPVL
ncbi:MAG: S8 family serine peptidase, partial [Bacteroidota bacterium]